MHELTAEQLHAVMPSATLKSIEACLPHINAALAEFAIDNPKRVAAFISQIAHETGQLHWLREVWGPTKDQLHYDPPSNLAKGLGNTKPGDGKKYRGRGGLQITGKSNYRVYGRLLSLPLEEQPELAELPDYAFRIAGAFWNQLNLNPLADIEDFKKITLRINGGYNGLAEREQFYRRAKQALANASTGDRPVAPITRPIA